MNNKLESMKIFLDTADTLLGTAREVGTTAATTPTQVTAPTVTTAPTA